MSKRRSKSHNTALRNFLCGNRLQQLEVASAKRFSAYTLPTIPAICKATFLNQVGYSDILLAFCASINVTNF